MPYWRSTPRTIPLYADGLPVKPLEYVTIRIGSDFPWVLPTAYVTHWRWVSFPHVLGGSVLCLYLNPSTQWDPTQGAAGYLARVSDWFAEAVAGEFDAKNGALSRNRRRAPSHRRRPNHRRGGTASIR